jgi:SAM-dependent methyltransferase
MIRTTRSIRSRLRRLIQLYAPSSLKRTTWNREYESGVWDGLLETTGDFIYPVIDDYAKGGHVLDLGCGSGATACDLDPSKYESYTGVDISTTAIALAEARTKNSARPMTFVAASIESFVPTAPSTVILFRDSLYYLRLTELLPQLNRYANSLTPNGVFIARFYSTQGSAKQMIEMIRQHFHVILEVDSNSGALALVFRPRATSTFD